MKKLITIALLFVAMGATAQTKATKDAAGNYVVAKRDTTGYNKPTGKTITDKDGKVFPVFISRTGKLFYNRISRSGNTYKSYIKEQ